MAPVRIYWESLYRNTCFLDGAVLHSIASWPSPNWGVHCPGHSRLSSECHRWSDCLQTIEVSNKYLKLIPIAQTTFDAYSTSYQWSRGRWRLSVPGVCRKPPESRNIYTVQPISISNYSNLQSIESSPRLPKHAHPPIRPRLRREPICKKDCKSRFGINFCNML